MLQFIKNTGATPRYKEPHVSYNVIDKSVRSFPTSAANTGTMFCPIYAEKGVDGVVKHFSGTNGYRDLINTYGEPNIIRFGLPYTAVVSHMLKGGDVVVISVKPEDATCSGFISYVQIETKNEDTTSIEKTLGWIKADGSGFVEDPYADTPAGLPRPTVQHIAHKIYTNRISFVTKEVRDIKNIDDLSLIVQSDFETEISKVAPGTKRVFPIMYGMYKGKGSYGNNFEFVVKKGSIPIDGRPTLNTFVRDSLKSETIENTQLAVSLNNDVYDGTPMYIESRYANNQEDFIVKSIDQISMNQLGKVIYDLFDKVKLFSQGTTLAGTQALALEQKINNIKEDYVKPRDPNYTSLQYFNPADMSDLGNIFEVSNIGKIKFTGGTDGILANEEKFDWEKVFEVQENGVRKNKYVYADMFKKAFTGGYTNEIFSYWSNPADYVIDMGYPKSVKEAMIFYAEKRGENQIIFNAPVNITTYTEAINFKQTFNYYDRNYTYCPANFEYLDPISNRTVRVPMSFALMGNIIEHYENGFYKPISGTINNGLIRDVMANTHRGLGDMSMENNDILLNAGYLVCKHYRNGQLYLNSQRANYKLNEDSALQEFHNNSIVNRIIKEVTVVLQDHLHRLTSSEDLMAVQNAVNQVLAPYANKVQDISYTASYKNPFDRSYGMVTHDFNIVFFRSMKNHHFNVTALGSDSSAA